MAQLVALQEKLAAGQDVDCEGCDNADPTTLLARAVWRGELDSPSWRIAYN